MVKRFVWLWGPVIGWAGLIFWWSSIPSLGIGGGPLDFILRKTAHVTEYALLWMLVHRALAGGQRIWAWRIVMGAILLTILYAVSDELHQHFVPTRSGVGIDVLIDAAGVALGVGVGGWWHWWNAALHASGRATGTTVGKSASRHVESRRAGK